MKCRNKIIPPRSSYPLSALAGKQIMNNNNKGAFTAVQQCSLEALCCVGRETTLEKRGQNTSDIFLPLHSRNHLKLMSLINVNCITLSDINISIPKGPITINIRNDQQIKLLMPQYLLDKLTTLQDKLMIMSRCSISFACKRH